ncbi:putative mitochondrial protein AtMg00310 [Apium graveolens]|uniref:putative mitochondrial protein AtMg00310 n=1 Tax=Apium graveolens TaxID=4045 RepID=UPI003D7A258A
MSRRKRTARGLASPRQFQAKRLIDVGGPATQDPPFASFLAHLKLQNWGCKAISKGEKCILLKTAAQTIPIFWMNLFRIPNEECESIEVQMNGYWWGHGREGKGIRWKAWDKLCVRKEAGGLRFRKLRQFNISMLAKQGWRLLNNVNPLVTSCMQARYYPGADLLTVKLGTNPSLCGVVS